VTRIHERIGGSEALEAAVDRFYHRVLGDEQLQPYFDGVDMERLRWHQHAFLAMALGGSRGYLGRSLAAAHAHLTITDDAFDRVMDHLVATLVELGVDASSVRDVGSALLPRRHDICGRTLAEPF
jgi:hemoglobin